MKANKIEKENGDIELTGKVIQKKFGDGSKSEHNAVYLETTEGDYQLRRLGGNPFSDPELNKLIGKKINATGIIKGMLFIAKKLTEIK